MKTFHLTIAGVGENIFDGNVLSLHVSGKEGVFTVLPEHEPLVSELCEGKVYYVTADGVRHDALVQKGGVIEISYNQATILL